MDLTGAWYNCFANVSAVDGGATAAGAFIMSGRFLAVVLAATTSGALVFTDANPLTVPTIKKAIIKKRMVVMANRAAVLWKLRCWIYMMTDREKKVKRLFES